MNIDTKPFAEAIRELAMHTVSAEHLGITTGLPPDLFDQLARDARCVVRSNPPSPMAFRRLTTHVRDLTCGLRWRFCALRVERS